MTTRRFRVFGRVQGVGFRFFTRRTAQEIGLGGWVRNCADGSVEVVATGTDSALARFCFLLKKGPAVSRVDLLEEQIVEQTELPTPFEVRH